MRFRTRFPKYRLLDPNTDPADGGNAGGGAAGDETNANANANADDNKDDKDKTPKPSDAEAKLLREVMDKKEALRKATAQVQELQSAVKRFEGIDPDQVRKLLEDKANAEQAELEKRGEFDRVKAQMIESHKQTLETIQKTAGETEKALREQLNTMTSQITELTIGRAFSDSSFVRDSLTLTPSKARVVYGAHFELNGSQVVAYDKPAGAPERTMLVNGSGEPLPFDQAIEKIIQADPDKDHLLKSKMKAGAGSNGDPTARKTQEVGSGRERIAAAIKGGGLKLPE